MEGLLVHVAVHGLEPPVAAQLLERVNRDEVARMQHQVRPPEPTHACFGEAPRPARQVRVRDDRDERGQRLARFCLAGLPTRNALLTKTALRATFSSAVSRMPYA